MTYQHISPTIRSLIQKKSNGDIVDPNQPSDYKGAINCGLPKAKCISNKDLAYEDLYRSKLKNGLDTVIGVIDDNNDQYMGYLGVPCKWYQFKCKKERKRIKM